MHPRPAQAIVKIGSGIEPVALDNSRMLFFSKEKRHVPTSFSAITNYSPWRTCSSHLAAIRNRQQVTLIREPDNRFDQHAFRIDWQGGKLGYIPAINNASFSQLLGRGETLSAWIVWLNKTNDRWERLEVEARWRV